jgi:hypothetical protein
METEDSPGPVTVEERRGLGSEVRARADEEENDEEQRLEMENGRLLHCLSEIVKGQQKLVKFKIPFFYLSNSKVSTFGGKVIRKEGDESLLCGAENCLELS